MIGLNILNVNQVLACAFIFFLTLFFFNLFLMCEIDIEVNLNKEVLVYLCHNIIITLCMIHYHLVNVFIILVTCILMCFI